MVVVIGGEFETEPFLVQRLRQLLLLVGGQRIITFG
jgi:hypothetical protein